MKKNLRILFLLILIAGKSTLLQAQQTTMVNVGDHSLEMIQAGEGDYTVIFESGFGTDYKVWGNIAGEVIKHNKVLLYSRAGTGQSEANPQPQSLEEAVTSLTTLLEKANAKPPYIFVGHSYGAFIIRSYAALHPEKVKGFVFVDPAHERLMQELKKADHAKAIKDTEIQNSYMPANFKAENELINSIFDKAALPGSGKLPDVPAVVLTSVQQREKPELFLHEPQGVKIWRNLHADLFSQFTNGAHYVTTRSGHNIHRSEPELVISAIGEVIQLANQEKAEQAYARNMQQLETKLKAAAPLLAKKQQKNGEAMVFNALKSAGLDENTINSIGYKYLSNDADVLLAVSVLKYNTVTYNSSANAFDSYGEALLKQGKTEPARQQFLKAIELATATNNTDTITNSKKNISNIDALKKQAKKK